MTNANDNAYPMPFVTPDGKYLQFDVHTGLSKREYFAAMAVVTEKEIDRFTSELTDYDPLVAEAWIRLKKADALINELNK